MVVLRVEWCCMYRIERHFVGHFVERCCVYRMVLRAQNGAAYTEWYCEHRRCCVQNAKGFCTAVVCVVVLRVEWCCMYRIERHFVERCCVDRMVLCTEL